MNKVHRCNQCRRDEFEIKFHHRTVNGKKYPKHLCIDCYREYKRKYRGRNLETTRLANQRSGTRQKKDRKEGKRPEHWIWIDSRRTDRKKKLDNDLTKQFIKQIIVNGCHYCDSHHRMTLDRVDNTIGHTKNNVLPCCYRCNMIRRNMPFEAWIEVSKGVKIAHKKGLFGEWSSGIK